MKVLQPSNLGHLTVAALIVFDPRAVVSFFRADADAGSGRYIRRLARSTQRWSVS
jgi:hypothetical protein